MNTFILKKMDISNEWEFKQIYSGYRLPEIQILFERLDKSVIEEERKILLKS